MAYDEIGVRFLLHAADLGVDYTNTATLGHQSLFGGEAGIAAALAACRGVHSPEAVSTVYRDCAGYVDGILRYLGAEHVDSIDASDYEDATVVHDLNVTIPPEMEERYSAVVEGGTLEHVFDFPTAIRNTMRMVRMGGHLILRMPVNNAAGHGFYQFSPELLFRVLSPRFGFRIRDAMIIEPHNPRSRWFRVTDPAGVGRRIQFRSHSRTVLFILAERVGPVPAFSPPPMQSDYASMWERRAARSESVDTPPDIPASVVAHPTGITRQARKLARRTVRRMTWIAQRSMPKRIQRSRRYRSLKVWVKWAIPRTEVIPHYTVARRGFKPVFEPWTKPARVPKGLRSRRDNNRVSSRHD